MQLDLMGRGALYILLVVTAAAGWCFRKGWCVWVDGVFVGEGGRDGGCEREGGRVFG